MHNTKKNNIKITTQYDGTHKDLLLKITIPKLQAAEILFNTYITIFLNYNKV